MAVRKVNVSPRQQGRLQNLLVDEGDQVEINRGSGHKDVSSWKGPGTVVSIGDPVTGDLEAGVRVKYQGGEEHVTFDQVRPFIGFAEIFAVAGDTDTLPFRLQGFGLIHGLLKRFMVSSGVCCPARNRSSGGLRRPWQLMEESGDGEPRVK